MSKTRDQIKRHEYLVGFLAIKIYQDYVNCLFFKPEPESFFERKMYAFGYTGRNRTVMKDVWRVFMGFLVQRSKVIHG